MKVFVTGASGFIGMRLCEALARRGDTVIAGLRQDTPGPWNSVVPFDLAGPPIDPSLLEGVDCVFHLAGKAHALTERPGEEQSYIRINVDGTRMLLESCKRAAVKRMVFFSSVKVMGEGGEQVLDERQACAPETPYGRSKHLAENMVLDRSYVAEGVVLRLPMVYGQTDKGNLPRMIAAVSNGRFPPVTDSDNRRSMVHVDDVVRAALLAVGSQQATGQVYIVTDGHEYSTRQIYVWIREALGLPVPKWGVPLSVFRGLARVGDLIGKLRGRRFAFDTDAYAKLFGSARYSGKKLEEELGFRPQRDLRSALPEIVRFTCRPRVME